MPIAPCFSIPILRLSPKQLIDKAILASHIWVLPEAELDANLTDIRAKEAQFMPLTEVKEDLDPAATHWAILHLHNDSPYPINYLLRESNESQMQVFIVEGNRLVYSGQSGQFVKSSEEQLPEGISWEARVQIKLLPSQYQQIYLRSNHALQMTRPFDLSIEDYAHYQKNIRIRNLYQSLFQGALGILLIFHLLMFGVNRQKAYAFFSLYVLLQLMFFQYFYGLSKEWFWGEYPIVDLAYAALPILMPSSIILTNLYLLTDKIRRSTQWQKLKLFHLLSFAFFVLSLSLIYSQSWAKFGFRLSSLFALCNPLFVFYFLVGPYRKVSWEAKFFLLGTFILSLISSISSVLFFIDELAAGIIVQLAILLQIILFAIGLGYRQVKVAKEKEESQQSLIHQLKLKQAFETDLKLHFERKVTQRTAALEDQKNALLIAKKQAEKAHKLQSDLLSMIQYDIRTPIHAILGMSNLLQDEAGQEGRDQMLNTLHIASANLLGLVNNILDYSQIEAGEIRFEHESMILKELTDQLVDGILPLCNQKELALFINYDPQIPYELFGCQMRLMQILGNILHNAAKFTESGKIIFEIGLKDQTAHQALLHFKVKDSGLGIPFAEQKNIFRGLKKKKSSHQMPHQGRGLGLAIVSKLLALQGSQIQLESAEGEGSTFSFDLWLGLSSQERLQQQASLGDKKVLLVEDNMINQEVARRFLEQWGMQVALATNGVEALQKVDEQNFDLILLDLQMPIMDGYETAVIIGQHEQATIRNIPIIALSANSDQASRRKAKSAGIKRFIAKPFNPKDLKQKIESALGTLNQIK